MKKRVFIFAYYSYKDPVFQSAVLPYFKDFPQKDNYIFLLLTFEQKGFLPDHQEQIKIKSSLLQENIHWYFLRWHSGTLKIFKKIWDLVAGIAYSIYIIKKNKADIVFSEGFPGCAISHYISKISSIPHCIHTFEPHADYMEQSGIWSKRSWEYKLLKKLEWKIACDAYCIFTATDLMVGKIRDICKKTLAYRVPSCVELNLFKYSEYHRTEIRKKLNLSDHHILICYLGKIGGMYWDEELFEFFHLCFKSNYRFRFLIISNDNEQSIQNQLAKYDLYKYSNVVSLTRAEVPAYLSAADFGLTAIKPIPSRRYSSPIKNGEYWACGLPIIIPTNISDDYLYAQNKKIGIVLEDETHEGMKKTIQEILEWSSTEKKVETRNRCRSFVLKDRNVSDYQKLYQKIFNSI